MNSPNSCSSSAAPPEDAPPLLFELDEEEDFELDEEDFELDEEEDFELDEEDFEPDEELLVPEPPFVPAFGTNPNISSSEGFSTGAVEAAEPEDEDVAASASASALAAAPAPALASAPSSGRRLFPSASISNQVASTSSM